MAFSRQEFWSGLTFPSPGHLHNPGIEPMSPALASGFAPESIRKHIKSNPWAQVKYGSVIRCWNCALWFVKNVTSICLICSQKFHLCVSQWGPFISNEETEAPGSLLSHRLGYTVSTGLGFVSSLRMQQVCQWQLGLLNTQTRRYSILIDYMGEWMSE